MISFLNTHQLPDTNMEVATPNKKTKKISIKYVLFLFIITLVLFWKIFLNPTYIVGTMNSDLVKQISYWSYFKYKSVNEFNQLPLWNPYSLSGYPFAGHVFSFLFNPSRILFYFFLPDWQFGFIFFIHFFLGGVFMYLYLRALDIDDFSSFIASVTYILSVKLVYFIYTGHLERGTFLASVPLLFYLVEKYFRKKQTFYLVLISIVLTYQYFGDHTQLFFYTLLILSIYYIFRAFIVERIKINFFNLFKYLCIFFSVFLIFILLSAIQFLPTLEYFQFSNRIGGLDYQFVSSASFPPYYITILLIPDFFGSYLNNSYWGIFGLWNLAIYIGILPLILVFFGILNRNKYTLFFLFLALFSLIFAMGKYTPLFYLFYEFVPGFDLFRAPVRMLLFFNFALAVLVGYGTNFFLYKEKNKEQLEKFLKIISVILIFSVIVLFLFYFLKSGILMFGENLLKIKLSKSTIPTNSIDYYLDKLDIAYKEILSGLLLFTIFLFLSLFLIYMKIKKIFKIRIIKLLIFLIIFLDIGLYSMTLTQVNDTKIVFEKNRVIDFLEKDKDIFRVVDLTQFTVQQQITIRYNISIINGYDPMIMGDYIRYTAAIGNYDFAPSNILPLGDIHNEKMLNLLNTKYIISNRTLSDSKYELAYNTTSNLYLSNAMYYLSDRLINDSLSELIKKQKIYVYFNRNFLPRAFIVPNGKIADRNKVLDEMKKENFNAQEFIFLEKNIDMPLINNAYYKEAKIAYYSPNQIKINTRMEGNGFLVLSEIWYPGWKAFDNGKELEVYRANYLLRAVYLNKGDHSVDFIYDPLSFKIGLWITIITSLFILIYFLSLISKRQ